MKKFNFLFIIFLLFNQNIIFAKKYIIKSQNIIQQDKNDFPNDDNSLKFDLVADQIKHVRNKFYRYGHFIKKKKFYNNIIISMSKYYFEKLKKCSNDKERKKIRKEYYAKLKRINENKNYKNIWLRIGVKQEFFDIEREQTNLIKKLHSKGFFDANINVKTYIDGNFISVDYLVTKNQRYIINSYNIDGPVGFLQKELNSFIKVNEGFDEDNFFREQALIYKKLKNAGFVFVKNQDIQFFLVKDNEKKNLDVTAKVLFEDNKKIKPFKFDNINVQVHNDDEDKETKTFTLRDINFTENSKINRYLIYKKIPIRKNQLYSLKTEHILNKKILQTEVFNSINTVFELDEQQNLLTTIHLYQSKQFENSTNIGLKKKLQDPYGMLNPYLESKLSAKNLFKLLETTYLSGSYIIDVNFEDKILVLPEINIKLAVFFPYFFPFIFFVEKEHEKIDINTKFGIKTLQRDFINPNKKDKPLNTTKSKFKYNFSYENQSLDFTLIPFELSWYKGKKNDTKKFIATMTRLKYHINFDKKNMNNGSFLEDIIEFASYKKQDNTTLNCKYLKNVFIFKKNFNITKDLKFVIRPIIGNIHFFDGSGDIITKPNVLQKIYFSVGGRTTIRGFELNSIGPGKNKFNNKQKPKGKILFVMNNEIRQSLNDVIELAAFFDVGNTWGSKPGEEFSARFINELALGCGFGIRFNFKLIVLSFDLALPIHHPVKGFFKDDNFIFYFGLNYPF